MVAMIVVAALALLALITQAGVLARGARPSRLRAVMIEVAGATLHVVDIRPARRRSGPRS